MIVEQEVPRAVAPPVARMAIAALSLVGLLIAGYLLLHRLGLVGQLFCGVGGACETVQSSRWATQLGIPVPLIGVGGYLVLFVLALIGMQPGFANDRRFSVVLLMLSALATGFSAYLTYLEAFVIHAWCRYCVASAIVILLVFVFSLIDLGRARGRPVSGEPT